MAIMFGLMLLLHIPPLYANGGIVISNVLLASWIGYKSLSIRTLKRWPLWVILAPVSVAMIDMWNEPNFKSIIFIFHLFSVLFVFPNIYLSEKQLAREVRLIVYVSLCFLGVFILFNLDKFGALGANKSMYWYPLATPNLIGVLSVIVIVLSFENNYHWIVKTLGIVSLAFLPLILGVFLALLVYATWKLHRYFKLLVLPFFGYLAISSWDPTLLDDTVRLDSLSSFRYSIWSESIEVLNQRPILGYGHEKWPVLMDEFINPHNFILYFLLTYGYIFGGLMVLVALFIAHSANRNKGKNMIYTSGILLVLTTYQLVYVGNIGHFSTFGSLITLLFGIHLVRPVSVRPFHDDRLNVVTPVVQHPLEIRN